MKKSQYPLEADLGMEYYVSDTPGIGGRLRSSAEDFVVEEIPVELPEGGPYLICRLEKKDWELQHAVKEIAKRLGISHRRIGWAGTKDRHAVTTQRISIYNGDEEKVREIRLKDISIEVLGHSREPLTLGSLKGNRFDIVIRELQQADTGAQMEVVGELAKQGLPNYYGIQRFGVVRPLTHTMGELILTGDFEQAAMTYIGLAFPDEPAETGEIRRSFYETRDVREALHRFPLSLSYERSMLHHLMTSPGDYPGALKVLPPKLLSMFVSAFQSWLFNMALSARIADGIGFSDPIPGDSLIFENGREDMVTVQNRDIAARHIERGRCRIAIHMPGSRKETRERSGAVIEDLLSRRNIGAENFKTAQEFVRTKFEGALRPVSLNTEVVGTFSNESARLVFELPPGHYATTVCREYMKADPLKMI